MGNIFFEILYSHRFNIIYSKKLINYFFYLVIEPNMHPKSVLNENNSTDDYLPFFFYRLKMNVYIELCT